MPIHDLKSQIAFHEQFTPKPLYKDAHSKAMLVCLDQGQQIPAHAESHQGFFYVIEGAGTFLGGEGEVPVQAGQLVIAVSGSTRGFRADQGRLVLLATALLL
ncbi:MAG: cupin domain-containing protein [Deltaproteobacteria bacterium]|nr:cupin domain-containing protein [Deltaproteobacteria bacterium]